MDKELRKLQLDVLSAAAVNLSSFALSGGTALELFYLNHRFSRDLDFFSPKYNQKEIEIILNSISKNLNVNINLENKLSVSSNAKVQFYTLNKKESSNILKIDFIEDINFEKPDYSIFNNVPVYKVDLIYLQKIFAIIGNAPVLDATGQNIPAGRNEVRDIIDLYYLSKKIKPLHLFINTLTKQQQRALFKWYQTFSRHDFKLQFLDYEIYDKNIDSRTIILYLENEIKTYTKDLI